jgi:hypothetical protein
MYSDLMPAIAYINETYARCAESKQGRTDTMQQAHGSWISNRAGEMAPLDDQRLFHRLILYLIFYFRHVDKDLIPADIRPYVDCSSDEYGECAASS